MTDRLRVEIEGGKYTVIQLENGRVCALRHGEAWRELTGDNLVLCLAQEVEHLRKMEGVRASTMIKALKKEGGYELQSALSKIEELRVENERLRTACRELESSKEGEESCTVCGRPCYESDATPVGYLCSRCCPHPAEEKIERAKLALKQIQEELKYKTYARKAYKIANITLDKLETP